MTLYLISYLSYVYFPTCTLKQSENTIIISFGHLWLSSRQETKNRENLVLIVWLHWFKSKPYGYTLNRSNSAYEHTICCIPIHAFLIHFLHDQFAIIYFRLLLNEIQLVFRWRKIHLASKSAFEFHKKYIFEFFSGFQCWETHPCEVILDEW